MLHVSFCDEGNVTHGPTMTPRRHGARRWRFTSLPTSLRYEYIPTHVLLLTFQSATVTPKEGSMTTRGQSITATPPRVVSSKSGSFTPAAVSISQFDR